MIVRKMRPEEIDVTVNLTRYYAQEAAETIPEIEHQYDTNSVINLIRGRTIEDQYFWFNAYEGQRPVGFVSGTLTAAQWNEEVLYCHIDLIYMLKEHRSIQAFKQLIQSAEEWANIFDCLKITAGDIGINTERTQTLYESLGFDKGLWMSKDI